MAVCFETNIRLPSWNKLMDLDNGWLTVSVVTVPGWRILCLRPALFPQGLGPMACSISAVTDPLIWNITSKAQASQSSVLQKVTVGNVPLTTFAHATIFKLIVQQPLVGLLS